MDRPPDPGSPTLSIVLCTYNNAGSLRLTLEQIGSMALGDPSRIELVLVDNNSPDDTADVAKGVIGAMPFRARYLRETRQGLSHARNTGVAAASGEYVLFTDDDAEIPPDWAQLYLGRIDASGPDCLFSRIRIIWDQPQPWWFDQRYNPCFVHLDYGSEVREIRDRHHEFFGKNFALRRSILGELGGFDPKLGRQGAKLTSGEETLIYRRLVDAGHRVVYFPEAEVGHRLKPHEYGEAHARRWMLEGAASDWYIATLFGRRTLFGRPVYVLKEAVFGLVRHPLGWARGKLLRDGRETYFHRLRLRRSLEFLSLWLGGS